MNNLITALETFTPSNEEEAQDKETILATLKNAKSPNDQTSKSIFERPWPAHFTTSAWTIDPSHTKTLMVYHNIYDSWSWVGGHADGNTNLCSVAERELKEETGIQYPRLLQKDIFSCEVLTVQGHQKNGAYVPSHLHLNITYLFEADPEENLRCAPSENKGVSWFNLSEVPFISKEPWMIQHIYQKLIHRTQLF